MKKIAPILILSLFFFSSETLSQSKPVYKEEYLTDQSGNTYKTVKIGNQVWMAENLRAKNYLNGDKIVEVQKNDVDLNSKCENPIFCILKNENYFYYFYSFQTIIDNRGIAPIGWHVPTKSDWEELLSNSNNVNDFKSVSGWPEYERFYPVVECPNCENWNSEYRSKVACNRCKDTRRINSGKYIKSPPSNGNNRLKFNIKHIGVFNPYHDTVWDGFWASDFSSDVFDTVRKFWPTWVIMGIGMLQISHGLQSPKYLLPLRLIKNKE